MQLERERYHILIQRELMVGGN